MKKTLAMILSALLTLLLGAFLVACRDQAVLSVILEVKGLRESYTQHEIIDLSQIKVVLGYLGGREKEVPVDSGEFTLSPQGEYAFGDTSEVGRYEFRLSSGDIEFFFGYDVVCIEVTLDMNGGAFGGQSEIKRIAQGTELDLEGVAPEKEGEKFAGWFYDKALTRRVKYAIDQILFVRGDVTLYAGYDKDRTREYEYEIDDDKGTVTLTALKAELEDFAYLFPAIQNGVLEIPATVELYPVTAIADDFIGVYYFMFDAVTLDFEAGSQIKSIGDSAFSNCTLQTLYFPDSLEVVGEGAFAGNPLRGTLRLNQGLKRIEAEAFSSGSSHLEQITSDPDCALTYIGERAFSYQGALTEIALPQKLETIMPYAFLGCRSVKRIRLPASVIYIGLRAFDSMSKLSGIEVDAANSKFCSIDGILYSKDKTSLIRYCFGRDEKVFSLPSFVKEIHECAFSLSPEDSAYSLETLIMNEGLKYIGANAFAESRVAFVLPASLESFSEQAFKDWKGAGISVSEKSGSFAAKDGVLYSKDFSSLYVVPSAYPETSYTLPDSVKVIKSGAFLFNRQLKTITVGEDSKLEKIETNGLPIYTMYRLKAVYLFLKTPFEIQNGAFYAPGSLSTFRPLVYVRDDCYDAYADAWKEYDSTESGEQNFTLDKFFSSVSRQVPKLVKKIESLGFTPFDKVAAGVRGYLRTSYADSPMSFLEAMDMLDSIYPLFSDFEDAYVQYFFSFDEQLCRAMAGYIRNHDHGDMSSASQTILEHYAAAPAGLKQSLRSIVGELEAYTAAREELNRKIEEISKEILAFPLSADSFDAQAFGDLRNRCRALGVSGLLPLGDVSTKYVQLDASYLIWRLLTTKDFTPENRDELYLSIYGVYGSDYEYENLTAYFTYYLIGEEICSSVYGLSEYPAEKARFDEYCAEAVAAVNEKIENFDFTLPFDAEKYNALFGEIEDLGRLSELWWPSDKLYAIYARNDIAFLFENYPTINDGNYQELDGYIHQVDYYLGMAEEYLSQLPLLSEYYGYREDFDEFVGKKLQTVRDMIDAFEYSADRAQYEKIRAAADDLGSFFWLLDEGTDNFYTDELSRMALWNQIEVFLEAYPKNSVTVENYAEVEKQLYTYFDIEKNIYIYGVDYFISQAQGVELIPNYQSLLEYMEWFESFPLS